jgi:hypothetical protein
MKMPVTLAGRPGRAHSLWFCDAQHEGVHRWFETGFMAGEFRAYTTEIYPVTFPPGENAGMALSPVIGAEWQVAWPFTAIDQGNEAEFIERWLAWFGQAAQGRLSRPSSMPERPVENSWRR